MAGDLTSGGGGGSAASKGPRSSTRHQQFRDRAKTRVDDLQEILFSLQSARKESRSADAAVLEEQRLFLLRRRRRRRRKRGVELLVVGRQAESRELPLTAGISDWSEHLKLWVLGDLLTSVDFGFRLSMLVVQQQTKAAARMREKEIREREERVAAALAGKQEPARVHGQRNDASAASRTGAPHFGAAQREEGGPLHGAVVVAVLGQVEEAAYGQEHESRRDENLKYNCKCSFLEIYNEQITDLLDLSSTNLQLHEDMRVAVYVENLTKREVTFVSDIITLLMQICSEPNIMSMEQLYRKTLYIFGGSRNGHYLSDL
ncbi:Kinesin-like protein KIF15 [Hordeum vulgare]|nr:Kinesin-like protein KIF15 [Hordeum vulgare]